MVTRIVKMTFKPETCADFLSLFEQYKFKIRNAQGCLYLELLREKEDGLVFFTYSRWQGEEFLELYRNSQTFAEVWPKTKALFADRPEAWTLHAEVIG